MRLIKQILNPFWANYLQKHYPIPSEAPVTIAHESYPNYLIKLDCGLMQLNRYMMNEMIFLRIIRDPRAYVNQYM